MNSQLTVINVQNLFKICPLQKIQLYDQELVLVVKPKALLDILTLFKYHISYQFNLLTCITGVDYPKNKYKFKFTKLNATPPYNKHSGAKPIVS